MTDLWDLACLACHVLKRDAPARGYLPTADVMPYWTDSPEWRWLEIGFKADGAERAAEILARALRELNVVQFMRLPPPDKYSACNTASDDESCLCVRVSYYRYHFARDDGDADFSDRYFFDVAVKILPYHGFVFI